MSRHRFTLSAEVDDGKLADWRDRLRAELPDDATQEERDDADPGGPADWTSVLTIVDAIDELVIVRTEVIAHEDGPAPWRPPTTERGRVRRFLAKIGGAS